LEHNGHQKIMIEDNADMKGQIFSA